MYFLLTSVFYFTTYCYFFRNNSIHSLDFILVAYVYWIDSRKNKSSPKFVKDLFFILFFTVYKNQNLWDKLLSFSRQHTAEQSSICFEKRRNIVRLNSSKLKSKAGQMTVAPSKYDLNFQTFMSFMPNFYIFLYFQFDFFY